ncbi:MAG: hypothetical protein HY598_01860 [Candidatus Omnitrophica bacterium]|nr:hypothetical protein [Candidatus Omnitrophota bacterium]
MLAGCWVAGSPAEAAHLRTLSFTDQAATTSASGTCDEVALDSFGGTIAFISTANLTGSNPDGNPEVYAAPVFFQLASTPVQVTNTAGTVQAHPKLNGDGSLLIFQSTANLDPSVGNADGGVETFSIDWSGSGAVFQQLTVNQAASETLPATLNPASRVSSADSNGDGTIVVFSSSSNQISGTSNPEGNPEIFVYDRLEGLYYQLTDTGTGINNLHPVIDDEGVTAAYITNQDGNYEVRVVNIIQNPVEEDPCVVDPTSCGNNPPTITVDPPGNHTVDENQTLTLRLTVSDPDGNAVALRAQLADGTSLVPLGVRLAYDSSSCDPEFDDCTCNPLTTDCFLPTDLLLNFTWRPTSTQGGRDYQILLTAFDEVDPAQQVTQLVNVTVVDANQPPVIAPTPLGTKTIKVGRALTPVRISASDVDCNSLTMSGTLPPGAQLSTPVFTPCPAGSTASRSTIVADLTWTPQPGQEGTHPVSVSVSDGTATVSTSGTITVVPNRPPSILITSAVAYERECFTLVLRGYDPDVEPIWFDVVASTLPPTAEFLKGTGALHWHPSVDLSSPTSQFRQTVTFTVSDGTDTVTRDVVISVVDSPDDQAVFLSPSALLTVSPGATVPVLLTVRNTGYTTWDGRYTVVTDYATPGLAAPGPAPLPVGTLAAGAVTTVPVSIQAPGSSGYYLVRFRMARDGQRFGMTSGSITLRVQ